LKVRGDEHSVTNSGRHALHLQGTIILVTVTVFLICREHAATMMLELSSDRAKWPPQLPSCVPHIVNNWTVIRLASFQAHWAYAQTVEWHHTPWQTYLIVWNIQLL